MLTKIAATIFGIFFTTAVFAVFTKHFPTEWGIYLALIFCAILIFCGFKFSKKASTIRLMTWGALVMTIVGIIGFFVIKLVFESFLTGI
jgi:hypothetical protein